MQNENNRYSYKPFIRQMYWVAFWLLIFAEFIVLRVNINEIMQEDWLGAIINGILASTVVLSLFYRLFFHIRPRVFSEYELQGDEILIWHGKRCKKFKFDQILQVRKTVLPPQYGGGFSVQLNTGQKFMFSTLLMGFNQFLNGVNNKKDLIPEKAYSKLSDQAKHLPMIWEYMQFKFKKWPVGLAKWVALPLVIGLVKYKMSESTDTSIWLFLGITTLVGGVIGVTVGFLEQKFVLQFTKVKDVEHLTARSSQVIFYTSSLIHACALIVIAYFA